LFDSGVSDICEDGSTNNLGGIMRTITTALATATIAALLTAAPADAADPRPPSRPGGAHVFGGADDQIRLGWTEPARTGSQPILRYVVRWTEGRMVVPASVDEVIVGNLEPGRYVFRVRAVSLAGAGPWSKSSAVYVP
jgi:hypothetical protein